jgi:hypothetical protein
MKITWYPLPEGPTMTAKRIVIAEDRGRSLFSELPMPLTLEDAKASFFATVHVSAEVAEGIEFRIVGGDA